MARPLVLFAIVCVFFFCGCSADAPERSSANKARIGEASNRSNTDPVNNLPSAVPTNGQTPANAPEGLNSTIRNKKLEDIRKAGGDPSAPKPDVETLLKVSERPAPEDSLFAVALVDIVVERRTFLKHPILAKVEKVTGTDGKSSIKVLTHDGRSFDLAGDAIGPVSTASTITILRATGLERQASDRKQRPSSPAAKN